MPNTPDYLYSWTDVTSNPINVYTDTLTLTYGMSVYNNQGVISYNAGPIVNNTFYIDQMLYGFEDKAMSLGVVPNHSNTLVFCMHQTPSAGDLAFDQNGNLISDVYFIDSTHIYDPSSTAGYGTTFEVISLADILNFNPTSANWTVNVTVSGDCNPSGSENVSAVDSTGSNSTIIYKAGTSLILSSLVSVTPTPWSPGNTGSATLVFQKAVNFVKFRVNTYTNSPVQSYTNCNIISQDPTGIIISPIDRNLPATLSYQGNF